MEVCGQTLDATISHARHGDATADNYNNGRGYVAMMAKATLQ
jgi:hypothetical protein